MKTDVVCPFFVLMLSFVYTNCFEKEIIAELCFDVIDHLFPGERVFHHPAANPAIIGKGKESGIDFMQFAENPVVFIAAFCFWQAFAQLLFITQCGIEKIRINTAKQA